MMSPRFVFHVLHPILPPAQSGMEWNSYINIHIMYYIHTWTQLHNDDVIPSLHTSKPVLPPLVSLSM